MWLAFERYPLFTCNHSTKNEEGLASSRVLLGIALFMKPIKAISMFWASLPTTIFLLLPVVLNSYGQNARAQSQLPESQQMEKETYLAENATIKTALVGSVTVGYSSRKNYENGLQPASPTVTLVRGGSITHTLTVTNSSKVVILGGRIGYRERNSYGGEVLAGGKCSVVFSGGTAYTLSATQQSTLTMTGGTVVSSVLVGEQATVNIKGGTIKGDFVVGPGGVLNLFGANIAKRLLQQGERGYFADSAEQEDQYLLSGMLSDGTALTGKVLRVGKSGDSKVNFVKALANPVN